jgi:hypothetical protein
MKIVSLTMVNNESEIIESFIRYNYNFFDIMVIIDNGCTDNTIKIVRKLISEGYSILVYDESLETYNQFQLDNKYLDLIIHELAPDIIIPLDADEFLIANKNPREALNNLNLNRIYYVGWQWYVLSKYDNIEEEFIPKRMRYCLKKPAWNYSDKSPVTKTIICVAYYQKMKLTLSMGHHTVFGNHSAEIQRINDIKIAHFRAISEQQLVYKTMCYTMRDIATTANNSETAQRTNHMALIERGGDVWKAAEEASFAGYPREIMEKPIDLSYCNIDSIKMKYSYLSQESTERRILETGREMAIKIYNIEREKKETKFVKPIIMWLDGVKGDECLFPDPTNRLTILTQMLNVRAYLTDSPEIKFLKVNFRLIITCDILKFLPYQYIVLPETIDIKSTMALLHREGLDNSKIITVKEYFSKLGIIRRIYCCFIFLVNMVKFITFYYKRNGRKATLKKITSRFHKQASSKI